MSLNFIRSKPGFILSYPRNFYFIHLSLPKINIIFLSRNCVGTPLLYRNWWLNMLGVYFCWKCINRFTGPNAWFWVCLDSNSDSDSNILQISDSDSSNKCPNSTPIPIPVNYLISISYQYKIHHHYLMRQRSSYTCTHIASPSGSHSGFRWVNPLCPLRTHSGVFMGFTWVLHQKTHSGSERANPW